MEIKYVYFLIALMLTSGGSFATDADAISRPGTIVRPTSSITGRADHSKPYLKADDKGVLQPYNASGRLVPGSGYKKAGDKFVQTNKVTGKQHHSKPYLMIGNDGTLKQKNAYGQSTGVGYEKVEGKVYQTNPTTGRIDYSKPQLKVIPPRH